MPSFAEFREAFRVHLGDDKFHEFLKRGTRPRLRYWQEQALDRFFQSQPSMRLSSDQVEAALRFCEVHRVELEKGEEPVFHGHLDYAPAYLQERAALFPHAAIDPVSTEGTEHEGSMQSAWFCPACRSIATQRSASAA
jgi:hypothetical protein